MYLWYALFQGVSQGMKQTYLYLWYLLFEGVGQGMKQTYLLKNPNHPIKLLFVASPLSSNINGKGQRMVGSEARYCFEWSDMSDFIRYLNTKTLGLY
jgi:hypothetical protein